MLLISVYGHIYTSQGQCVCVSIDHMHTTHSVHVHGREGGREGGKISYGEGRVKVKIHYVRTCTGTHEWSITTHSTHMRGGGECIIIGKGWGERENTTLTCTCMLYRHRSHTYCCVGG